MISGTVRDIRNKHGQHGHLEPPHVLTSRQSNLTQFAAACGRFSHIHRLALMCTKNIQSQKMFATTTFLSCSVSAISKLCWLITQTLSIANSLVTVVNTKPAIAILVPKLVAMALSLKTSKSAMSSLDSLTPNIVDVERIYGRRPRPLCPRYLITS